VGQTGRGLHAPEAVRAAHVSGQVVASKPPGLFADWPLHNVKQTAHHLGYTVKLKRIFHGINVSSCETFYWTSNGWVLTRCFCSCTFSFLSRSSVAISSDIMAAA